MLKKHEAYGDNSSQFRPSDTGEPNSSGKFMTFLVFNATWRAESAGKLLKLRCSLGITGLNCTGVLQKESQSVQKCRL